jgi:hypothetical protein
MLVRMRIPFPTRFEDKTNSLQFAHFLPEAWEQFMAIPGEGMSLTFWFDRTCLALLQEQEEIDRLDLSKCANVRTEAVMADVKVETASSRLIEHVRNGSPPDIDEEVSQEYARIAKDVYTFTVTKFNRLIAYARNVKGQFWLEEHQLDADNYHSAYLSFDTKVRIDDKWCSWRPTGMSVIRDVFNFTPGRYLTLDDWLSAGDFVRSKTKTPLVGQLLAGAEMLEDEEHRRAALTEATTALEVAVYEFAASPDADQAFGKRFAKRLGVNTLGNQVDRFGLRGTVRYLLPLLFSEEQLPTEVLKGCQAAIDDRQNVVHNGQRDVGAAKLGLYLRSIRRLCDILGAHMRHSSEVPGTGEPVPGAG